MKKIINTVICALLLNGCDADTKKIIEEISNQWDVTEKIDKLSGKKQIIGTQRFDDSETPSVIVDVDFICEPESEGLWAKISTYEAVSRGDVHESVRITSAKPLLISSRSGDNSFEIQAMQSEYNNVMEIILTEVKYGGRVVAESEASNFVSPEWIFKVKTEKGNPTISMNLDSAELKKVFHACKWYPAFDKENTNHIKVKTEPPPVVEQNSSKIDLPFIGLRQFNIMGGNATEMTIEIKDDGETIVRSTDLTQLKSIIEYQGPYQKLLKLKNGMEVYIENNKIFSQTDGKPDYGCIEEDKVCESELDILENN